MSDMNKKTEIAAAALGQVSGGAAGAGVTTIYICRKGDTLNSIAASQGTTVPQLKKDNHISSDADLFPGKTLIITKQG